MPRDVGVVLHDLGVGIRRGEVVIELPAAVRDPARQVVAKLDPAQRRVVPQQAVAFARDDEGHHVLHVPLVQVDHAALQVDRAGIVEPHAVEALALAGREMQLGVEKPVAAGPEDAGTGIVGPDDVILFAQDAGFRL